MLAFAVPPSIEALVFNSSAIPWSAPIRVSEPGGFAYSPFVVADEAGNLHAVWSENDTDPSEEDLQLETVYYARKDDTGWTTPIDIFIAPTGGQARVNRLRIDRAGRLHMLWSQAPYMVYATALAGNAASARAWQARSIAESVTYADLAVSSDDVLHIVYILDRQGIYYIQSQDNGAHWSSPTTIWRTPDTEHSSGSVRIEVGEDGVIHVAWGISGNDHGWKPMGIAYARSVDSGQTWEQTLTVMEGDNLPNIGFDQQGGVHLVWDNPAGSILGRGHAWSTDNGKTWQRVERIFPGYRGQTLWPVIARDSAGTLHLVFAANSPKSGESQVFHSMWSGNTWTEPKVISGNLFGGESPSLAISEGNRLNVMWFSYRSQDYGIWYTAAEANAPSIAPRPLPTAATVVLPSPKDTSSPTPSPASLAVLDHAALGGNTIVATTWTPTAAGILSCLAVIGAAVSVRFLRRKR